LSIGGKISEKVKTALVAAMVQGMDKMDNRALFLTSPCIARLGIVSSPGKNRRDRLLASGDR
jgi:hypothetical protein